MSFQPIVLHFDALPLAVIVNGKAAQVEGESATWQPDQMVLRGTTELTISWTNPDGSSGMGAQITVRNTSVGEAGAPQIVGSQPFLFGGEVDAALLNASGITIKFDRAVRQGMIQIRPKGGQPLVWTAFWETSSVTITPTRGSELLNNTTYIIEMTGVVSATHLELTEPCNLVEFTTTKE